MLARAERHGTVDLRLHRALVSRKEEALDSRDKQCPAEWTFFSYAAARVAHVMQRMQDTALLNAAWTYVCWMVSQCAACLFSLHSRALDHEFVPPPTPIYFGAGEETIACGAAEELYCREAADTRANFLLRRIGTGPTFDAICTAVCYSKVSTRRVVPSPSEVMQPFPALFGPSRRHRPLTHAVLVREEAASVGREWNPDAVCAAVDRFGSAHYMCIMESLMSLPISFAHGPDTKCAAAVWRVVAGTIIGTDPPDCELFGVNWDRVCTACDAWTSTFSRGIDGVKRARECMASVMQAATGSSMSDAIRVAYCAQFFASAIGAHQGAASLGRYGATGAWPLATDEDFGPAAAQAGANALRLRNAWCTGSYTDGAASARHSRIVYPEDVICRFAYRALVRRPTPWDVIAACGPRKGRRKRRDPGMLALAGELVGSGLLRDAEKIARSSNYGCQWRMLCELDRELRAQSIVVFLALFGAVSVYCPSMAGISSIREMIAVIAAAAMEQVEEGRDGGDSPAAAAAGRANSHSAHIRRAARSAPRKSVRGAEPDRLAYSEVALAVESLRAASPEAAAVVVDMAACMPGHDGCSVIRGGALPEDWTSASAHTHASSGPLRVSELIYCPSCRDVKNYSSQRATARRVVATSSSGAARKGTIRPPQASFGLFRVRTDVTAQDADGPGEEIDGERADVECFVKRRSNVVLTSCPGVRVRWVLAASAWVELDGVAYVVCGGADCGVVVPVHTAPLSAYGRVVCYSHAGPLCPRCSSSVEATILSRRATELSLSKRARE
jgi:hypothetical protein